MIAGCNWELFSFRLYYCLFSVEDDNSNILFNAGTKTNNGVEPPFYNQCLVVCRKIWRGSQFTIGNDNEHEIPH